VPNAIKLKS